MKIAFNSTWTWATQSINFNKNSKQGQQMDVMLCLSAYSHENKIQNHEFNEADRQ